MSKLYVDEIRPKTSGNQVLFPEKPAFSVYLATTTANADYTTTEFDAPFDTIDFNIGNCVAISNDVATFTAPVDGIYHFNSMVQIQNAQDANWVDSQWHIDGAKIGGQSDFSYRVLNEPISGIQFTPLMQSQAVQLNANQTLNVKFRVNGDTSVGVRSGTRFSGYLVG